MLFHFLNLFFRKLLQCISGFLFPTKRLKIVVWTMATACSMGAWDCPNPVWQACYPRWGQGHSGICRCNRFLGLSGSPDCDEMTEVSFICIALLGLSCSWATYAQWGNIRFLWALHEASKFGFDVITRTALINAITPIAVIFECTGLSLAATGHSGFGYFYYRHVRVFTHVAMFGSFMGATSSVFLVWLELAEKTASAHRRQTGVAFQQSPRTRLDAPLYRRRVLLSSITAAAIIVASYLLYSGIFVATTLGAVIVVAIGASFHVGGQRINLLLDIVALAEEEGAPQSDVQARAAAIAAVIRRTSRSLSWLCIGLGISLSVTGIMLPSPTPLYKTQNDLPPMLNGQFGMVASQVICMQINMGITNYLWFWMKGSRSRRVVTPIITRVLGDESSLCESPHMGPRGALSTINEVNSMREATSAPPSGFQTPEREASECLCERGPKCTRERA